MSSEMRNIENFNDVNVYKDVFKLILCTMSQDQHYEMIA